MFDDIMVPKSYLKGLLDKGYEKYLSTNHTFQTKDFESMMDVYKVYRQHLYLKEYPRLGDSFVYDKRKKKTKAKMEKTNRNTHRQLVRQHPKRKRRQCLAGV